MPALIAEHMVTWRRYMQHTHFLYHISADGGEAGGVHQCNETSCVSLNAGRQWYGCETCGRTHFCQRSSFATASEVGDPCPVRLNGESYPMCCMSGAVLVDDGPTLVAGTYEESVVLDEKLYENADLAKADGDRQRVAATVADARRSVRRAQFSASTLVRQQTMSAYRAAVQLRGLRYQADIVRGDVRLERQRQRRLKRKHDDDDDKDTDTDDDDKDKDKSTTTTTMMVPMAMDARASKRRAVLAAAGPTAPRARVHAPDEAWNPTPRDVHYWALFERHLTLVSAFRRFARDAPASAACLRIVEMTNASSPLPSSTQWVDSSALAATLRAQYDAVWHAAHCLPMPTLDWRQSVRDLLGRAVAWIASAAPTLADAETGAGAPPPPPPPSEHDLDVHVDRLVRWIRLLRATRGTTLLARARGAVATPPIIVAVAVYLRHLAPTPCVTTDSLGRRRVLYQPQAFFAAGATQERVAVAFGLPTSAVADSAAPGLSSAPPPPPQHARAAAAVPRVVPKAVARHSVDLALGGDTAADARRELVDVDERHKALRRSKQRLNAEGAGATAELDEGRPTSVAFAPDERCTAVQIRDLHDLLWQCVFGRDVVRDGAWFTDWFLSSRHQCWPARHLADDGD